VVYRRFAESRRGKAAYRITTQHNLQLGIMPIMPSSA
jgi:hypothetical protein